MTRYLFALLLCSCAVGVSGGARFANKDPVWIVNDRTHVAKQPKGDAFSLKLYAFDRFFARRVSDALAVRKHRRAMNVNAMDEVPNSTWFTNRIGDAYHERRGGASRSQSH